jgi:hypothetical protein
MASGFAFQLVGGSGQQVYFTFVILHYAYALNSAEMGLEGRDIPEAAYVASLCLLKETTLHKQNSKGWHIRSLGCHRLCSEGPPPRKVSRPSVSGGNGSALKTCCGAKLIGVFYILMKCFQEYFTEDKA